MKKMAYKLFSLLSMYYEDNEMVLQKDQPKVKAFVCPDSHMRLKATSSLSANFNPKTSSDKKDNSMNSITRIKRN